MLSNLHIGNFRAFKPLKIDKLARINIVSGENNAGKTSLLEAIFLLSGAANPSLLLNANVIRGITVVSGSEQIVRSALWKPIFHDLDMSQAIEVSGHHFSKGEITIRLSLERPNLFELPLDNGKVTVGDKPQDKETFTLSYLLNRQSKADFNITLSGNTMQVQTSQPEVQIPFPATILSSRNRNTEEDAQRLGHLRQQKKADLVVEALRVIEPRLQGLEVNTATGSPMIWGDVGLSELVPLPVMGDGMIQLARIVLAIATAPGGVVLVDEIENGLHHAVLPKVWQVIETAVNQFDSQMVATTHSHECIAAAENVFKASAEDMCLLHRIERLKTGVRCVTYGTQEMAAAMQHNVNVH